MNPSDSHAPGKIVAGAVCALLVALPALLYLIPAQNGGAGADAPFLALILVAALLRQCLALALLAACLALVRRFPFSLVGLASLLVLVIAHAFYWAASSRAQLVYPAAVLPMTPWFNIQANVLARAASLEGLCMMYSVALICCIGAYWLWQRRQRGPAYGHSACMYAAAAVLYGFFGWLEGPGAIRGAMS